MAHRRYPLVLTPTQLVIRCYAAEVVPVFTRLPRVQTTRLSPFRQTLPPNSSHWRSAADPGAHRVLRDASRLSVLRATNLLNGSADEVLDGLARVVCTVLGVPVAAVSLVDDRGQSFAGLHGLDGWARLARGTPLSHSFCQHVVIGEAPLVVEDARQDDRVRENLAIDDLGVVAYAGVPLTTRDGETLGALCAIATEPRPWLESDLATLRDLATAAVAQLQLRAALDEITVSYEQLRDEQDRLALEHSVAGAVDSKTGLRTRAGFEQAIRAVVHAAHHDGHAAPSASILHSVKVDGDDVALMSVAAAMVEIVGPEAICAHVSPNSFAVLKPRGAASDARPFIERLVLALGRSVRHSFAIRHGQISVPHCSTDAASVLLRAADGERDVSSWIELAPQERVAPTRPDRTERRILILDDYPTMLRWARIALEAHGWTVHTAVATDEALALAAQLRAAGTPIDVVLCDETLASIDCDSIGLLLRFDDPALPVVKLRSGLASNTRWPKQASSFDTTLSKPLMPNALQLALDHVVQSAVQYAERS